MALMPASRRSLSFRNDDAELRRLSRWFRDFARQSSVPDSRALDFELCLNELVTNVIRYAYGEEREHEIRVTLERDGGELRATVEDDGWPFDPLGAPPPEPPTSLAETRIGGWGLPIVRALADEIFYERREGWNRVTIVSRGG